MRLLSKLNVNVKEVSLFLAAVAAVIVLLPLLGIVAFTARFLVILAIPVVLLALIASPAVRFWLSARPDRAARGTYRGLQVPERVLLHPYHTWAQRGLGRSVTVGVDDLLQRVMGPTEEVRLPRVGGMVLQGGRLFEVRRGKRRLSVKSPISGQVVAVNERLQAIPQLLNRSPYEAGWAVKIRPKPDPAERRRLLRESRARMWFRDEVDSLVEMVNPDVLDSSVAQDGGTLVGDLHGAIDEETWKRVHRRFFGTI